MTFKDVLAPFVVLSSANVVTLCLWTVITPVQFLRVEDRRNYFGIVVESSDRCSSLDWLSFLVPLLIINGAALALACHQAYNARNVPTQLNESKSIAMAMLSIFQGLFFGVPLVFLTYRSDSSAFLYVATSVVVVICLATNLFIFAPKVHAVMEYVEKRTRGQTGKKVTNRKSIQFDGTEQNNKPPAESFPLTLPACTGGIIESILPSITVPKMMDTNRKVTWPEGDSCDHEPVLSKQTLPTSSCSSPLRSALKHSPKKTSIHRSLLSAPSLKFSGHIEGEDNVMVDNVTDDLHEVSSLFAKEWHTANILPCGKEGGGKEAESSLFVFNPP